MTSLAITGEVMESPALVRADECRWVRETATGLQFRPDTPIEVWAEIAERLQRQQKRIEWALGDALQFGERTYGDMYVQWAEETGLSENTLATIKWVAGKIESSRRREDVGWSHHREVAALDDPQAQDRLLEVAAEKGMTRWEVRQAVKVEKERVGGRAVDASGAPIEEPDPLAWVPQIEDVVPDMRRAIEAQAPSGRHRLGWIAGALWVLVYQGHEEAFLPGRWRP